jgi:two-component system, NtrC family, sensor histidine kinase HydH
MFSTSQYVVNPQRESASIEIRALEPAGTMSTITPGNPVEKSQSLGDRLSTAFQAGIIQVDSRDKLSVCTPAALRLLQLSSAPGTLEGLPNKLKKLIHKARVGGQALLEQKTNLSDAARKTPELRISVLPTGTSKSSSPVTVILQHFNPELEKNLQQLDRLANFGTLSAGIAHEIKNALVVSKTFFDLLLEKEHDAELVPLVRRELKRIETLVTQMVRYNTPAKPTFSEIHVHQVLNHSLLMVERQLKDKAINLERDYLAGSDQLQGDDFQLEQAFVNLLLNAVDAMGYGGRLSVSTRAGYLASKPPGSQLEISIQDDGIGIAPEDIGKLFDPFFTTKTGGTGLGLPITRQIIEQHGGRINVTSQPHTGTCFQILLPAA